MSSSRLGSPRRRLAALAAAGLGLPLAAVLAIVLATGGGETDECEPERPQVAPIEAATVAEGPDPLPWKRYAQPVGLDRLRHNHLHGGIVVEYGERVPAAAVAELASWYEGDPVAVVVAPRPELGDTLLATAWAGRLRCIRFDRERFVAFREEHRFEGPESPPREELAPARSVEGLRASVREIAFVVGAAGDVAVEIRDSGGRVVRELGNLSVAGRQALVLTWDGRDDRLRPLAPGRYEAVVRAGGDTVTARFLIAPD